MNTKKITKAQLEKQLKNAKETIKRREGRILQLQMDLEAASPRAIHLERRRIETIIALKKVSSALNTLISQLEVCP